MARLQINMESTILGFNTALNVVIPQMSYMDRMKGVSDSEYYNRDNKLPVLFLLHGGGGNESDWLRFTRIEELAERKKLIIVCPTGQNSSYSNMAFGAKWFDYITEEVYDFVHAVFPASTEYKDNYIAGLSMGGYGTMKAALRCPEKYSYAASLSGAANIVQQYVEDKFVAKLDGFPIFGDKDKAIGGENDLFALATKLRESGKRMPTFYSACGTEDFTYEGNVQLRDHMKELGFDLTWVEGPGAHTWDFWNTYIEKVLDWLPLKANA